MRCSYYCTAERYDNDNFAKYLRDEGQEPKFYDQVIHIQTTDEEDNTQDAFFFPYGCTVFWNYSIEEEAKILSSIKSFEIKPLNTVNTDASHYLYNIDGDNDSKTIINEEEDEIVLGTHDALIKLSMSYALSQSVKLTVFEKTVEETISNVQHLPEELSSTGKISLSRKKLSQKIGALFSERYSINLHCDVLDTPEFFWRRPKYEPYYLMAMDYMDITIRLDILNRKLDVIHELYEILSTELNHRHSSRLELIIILLILFEVIMMILKDFAHLV